MRSYGVVRSRQYQKIAKPLSNISVCGSIQPDELVPRLNLLLFIFIHHQHLDVLMFEFLFTNNFFVILYLVWSVVLVDHYEVLEKGTFLVNFPENCFRVVKVSENYPIGWVQLAISILVSPCLDIVNQISSFPVIFIGKDKNGFV